MRIISKAELARWAGVSRAAITKACRTGGQLFDCADSRGVDVEHPIARQFLAAHGVHELPEADRATEKKPKPPPKADPKSDPPLAGDIPTGHDIQDLENLTVREVGMRYGSIDGFKRYVEALKNIAEYKHRELRVRQQRGDLIERSKVAGVVFPLIDVAFSRLVSDVPETTGKLVVARVESGGSETRADVVALIREANSRVLKNLKQSVRDLEVLKDAN